MKFDFKWGDSVAVLVKQHDENGQRVIGLDQRAQTYDNIEWLTVTDDRDVSALNDTVVNAGSNLLIFGFRAGLDDPRAVERIVELMAGNRELAGLIPHEAVGVSNVPKNLYVYEPYQLAVGVLERWNQGEGRSIFTADLTPICLYKSALRRVAYFSSALPSWYVNHAVIKYNRFFTLAAVPASRAEASDTVRQGQQREIFNALTMLYFSENRPDARYQILCIARRLFKTAGWSDKMALFRRHPEFILRTLTFRRQ